MTLDEAIKKAEYEASVYNSICMSNDGSSGEAKAYNRRCAEEYKELAEWLRELKKTRGLRRVKDLNDYSTKLWHNAYNRGLERASEIVREQAKEAIDDGKQSDYVDWSAHLVFMIEKEALGEGK